MTVPDLHPQRSYTIGGLGGPGRRWVVMSVAHGYALLVAGTNRQFVRLERLREPSRLVVLPSPGAMQ